MIKVQILKRDLILIFIVALFSSLSTKYYLEWKYRSNFNHLAPTLSSHPTVSPSGERITFKIGDPGLQQIVSIPVQSGKNTLSITAPGRVVVTSIGSPHSTKQSLLFESSEVTSLFSQFRQGKANYERATKNTQRIKDMFQNEAATGKELNDSENELANSRALLNEYESRLRTSGFHPKELDDLKAGYAWLLADVPETQLHEVEKGEEVKIQFDSFPDESFIGTAEAIGGAIDPVTRTVKVRVSLPNKNSKFMPGMYAHLNFGTVQGEAFLVPPSYLISVEQNDYLFSETSPGVFERKKVSVLEVNSEQFAILRGLVPNDKVVIQGTMLLKGLSFGY